MVPLNIYVAPFLIENYEMGIYEKLGFFLFQDFRCSKKIRMKNRKCKSIEFLKIAKIGLHGRWWFKKKTLLHGAIPPNSLISSFSI